MATATEKVVLITGGTGNQGGATVKRLLEGKRVHVRVLTRSPDSPKAQQLVSQGVDVVAGDLDDADSLRRALSGISAAFSVQSFMDKGGVEAEERRGKAFADAVKAARIPYLVYSSADGVERNSGIPHYESKRGVELHIRELGLPVTILRPVAFMDNFAASPVARGMALGMFRNALGHSKRVQFVAVSDIGWFAARALEDPERFTGREISIAGDKLSVPEIISTYRRVTGRKPWVAPIPPFLPKMIMPKEIVTMFEWMGSEGFRADIPALKAEHPGLLTFFDWLSSLPARK